MARLPEARLGVKVKEHLSGFPFFTLSPSKGILIGDIWEYLKNLAVEKIRDKKIGISTKMTEQREALSYISQAFEFYEAARNPRLRSRPLLYYYSFMNLAKLYLLLEGVKFPVKVYHGIKEIEERRIFMIRRAAVDIFPAVYKNKTNLYALFAEALGYPIPKKISSYRVTDLLRQIPCINDTFSRVVRVSPNFIRISSVEIVRESNEYWVRIFIRKGSETHRNLVRGFIKSPGFTKVFKRVVVKDADNQSNFIFDFHNSLVARGKGPSVNKVINTLGLGFDELKIAAILTREGYRYYFNIVNPSIFMPCLAAEYAVAFYLGSITRYRPHSFDNINRGRIGALISEYLSIVPSQFVYKLASKIAKSEVLMPYGML